MSAESERRTETIPDWKREEVGALVAMIERHDSVGVVEVSGIPSRQLQQMRAELHGDAELRIGRNTLVRRALEEVDEGLEAIAEYVTGQVGLVGTDDNPFMLYRRLEASKTPAPINPGDVAPKRIVIPAGDTGIDPGPFVGELQAVGAAARIMEGSIRVTEESVVAEPGDVVEDRLATVLAELGIEPKEVGLDLRAVFADGIMFEADELAIDVDEYRADIQSAAARARNLSINAGIPTARTLPAMLSLAGGQAKAVGLAAAVESPDLADDLVGRADAQLRALAALIDDEEALPDELRSVPPAESAGTPPEPDDGTADDAASDTNETEDADAGDDESEDEDDVSGAGLGDLFG